MPVTVHALHNINDPAISTQIEKLYQHSHEFTSGQHALTELQNAMQQDTCYYVAMFNDKIIGSIWSTGTGTERLLRHVVVHPANRGRGIAERLISEVCRLDEQHGVTTFQPYCGAIRKTLIKLGKYADNG